MKLLLITISIVMLYLSGTQNVHAQPWFTSGSTTYTTNNVGLGTSNPWGRLHVAGISYFDNDQHILNGKSIHLYGGTVNCNTPAGVFHINANSSNTDGGTIGLYGASHSSRSGSMYFYSNATNPSGNTEFGGNLGYNFFSYNGSYNSLMRLYNNGKFALGAVGAEKLVVDAAGNVAVGIATPMSGYKLHVKGTTLLDGALDVQELLVASSDVWVDGKMGIGTNNPVDKLHVVGNSYLQGGVVVNGLLAFNNATYNAIWGQKDNGIFSIMGNTATDNGPAIELYGKSSPSNAGMISMMSYGDNNSVGYNFANYNGTGGWNSRMRIHNNGNVIVGSTNNTATDLFTVSNGNIGLKQSNDNDQRIIKAYTSTGVLNIAANNHAGDGPQISLVGKDNSSNDWYGYSKAGRISLCSYGTANINTEFITYDNNGGYWTTLACVKKDGKFVIGSDIINHTPEGYNLYVSKGILTEKIRVSLTSAHGGTEWADYVFNKDYDLMPLHKLTSFIEKNKHLPDVPSAAEVANDGIDLAKMDATLLQKIEELTLYVIELKKENELQQQQINKLKKK